jgi:hypothetical protein
MRAIGRPASIGGRASSGWPLLILFVVVLLLLLSLLLIPVPASAPGCSAPIRVTVGGSYSGCWTSTSSKPAVFIDTVEPVVITDTTITNLAGGPLVVTNPALPVNVTIENVKAYGGSGRFVDAYGFKSVTIRNSTIDKTGGISLAAPAEGASVLVTRNKHRNVQRDASGGLRQFVQFNQVLSATAEVSWNQVINEFGKSLVEDVISVYKSADVHVHDNYIQGGYPLHATDAYSGGGITVEQAESHGNVVERNQIVGMIAKGITFAGGANNLARKPSCPTREQRTARCSRTRMWGS